MALTAPPEIPLITDPNTFSIRAQDWVVWQADELYPFLVESSGILGLSTSATSTTSNSIGTGARTFTIESGKGFIAGQSLSIARTSAPTNRMFAVVTSYSGTSLVVNVQVIEGSGTFTDWSIALAYNGLISTAQINDEAVTEPKIATSAIANFTRNKIQPLTAVITTNTLVATLAPTTQDFRNTTLTSGTVTTITNASLNITASTTASLGLTTAVLGRIAVLEVNNAGTPVLCYANLAGGLQLDETNLISPTTIGAGSTSATVIYSASAVGINLAYKVVGFIDATWTTGVGWAITRVQGASEVSSIPVAFHANGDAPMYACRAWANFNGTGTLAIRASGNISSITDNGVGDYTVNFAIPMPDINYSVVVSVGQSGSTSTKVVYVNSNSSGTTVAPTTTSFRMSTQITGVGAVDLDYIQFSVFR